jgi:hypothetical protein
MKEEKGRNLSNEKIGIGGEKNKFRNSLTWCANVKFVSKM